DRYEMFIVLSAGLVMRSMTATLVCVSKNWAGRPETERTLPRRGDSRSLPVICDCECTLTPAGLEPARAAIADHPLASDGSLDQPPDATKHRSLPSRGCCAFF